MQVVWLLNYFYFLVDASSLPWEGTESRWGVKASLDLVTGMLFGGLCKKYVPCAQNLTPGGWPSRCQVVQVEPCHRAVNQTWFDFKHIGAGTMPKCSMGTNNRRVGWASLWVPAIWTPARANAGAGSLAAEKCHRRVDDIECSWTQITRQVSPCILHFTYTASCIFVRYTYLYITCSRCKCHLTYCILYICIKHIYLYYAGFK